VNAARFLRPTLPQLWAFLAVALPTLGALVAPMPTVDLAYQLRAGGQMLDGLGIPTSDTWTFTIAGQPWADQHWWAQLALAAVYRAAGWDGLAVLRAALVAAIFGLLFLVVRRRAPRLSARASSLLVLAAFLVASPALALRPQLFAMVLFVATLLVLADRANHPRRVWLIPLFALLWANLHGTFPLVIVLAGLAWLADMSGGWATTATFSRRRPTMLVVTVVAALATLANPLGLDVWTYVVRLSTNPTIAARISEWRPPGLTDAPGLLFWGSVVGVVALLAILARRRRARGLPAMLPWPALLTLLVFAVLGAVTGRGLAWWPLAAVFVLAGFLKPRAIPVTVPAALASPASDAPTGITNHNHDSPPPRGSPLNALVAGILIVAGIALAPLWRPVGPAGIPNGLLSYAPQGVAATVLGFAPCHLRPPGESAVRVWNPQTWGSWLEFAVPCDAFTVDSRIELYPASVWTDYDTVENAEPGWQDILARWGVQVIVTNAPTDANLDRALAADGSWLRVYFDGEGAVWTLYVPPTGS
jgi:hypothetical protein